MILLGIDTDIFYFFSGGIGITPIQSISNQLIYEYSQNKRDLKRLTLVWTERDPVLMKGCDVVRRSKPVFTGNNKRVSTKPQDLEMNHFDDNSSGIASTLLSLVPANHTSDYQLALDYPMEDNDGTFHGYVAFPHPLNNEDGITNGDVEQSTRASREERSRGKEGESVYNEDVGTIVTEAYKNSSLGNILDLQVYLTSKEMKHKQALLKLPFVRFGRPDIKKIFLQMRNDAILNGEKRVAVYVCSPARLGQICRNLSVKFSDEQVQFDFHVESPE